MHDLVPPMTKLPKRAQASTDGLSPQEAKAYWRDHVAEFCHGLQIEFKKNNSEFNGRVDSLPFGQTMLFDFRLGEHVATRLPHHIARDGIDCFSLSLVKSGYTSLSTKCSGVFAKENEVFLSDVGEPFKLDVIKPINMTTFFLEKSWLRSVIPAPENLLWRNLAAESGWGRALAAMMAEISPDRVEKIALPPQVVTDQIAALLALAAGPKIDCLTSSRQSLLKRLRRDMQDRLHDQMLDPSVFAREHGISKRTLHALFASAESSFMNELIDMRLERAHSLLRDRRFAAKTISEIALLVGFVNANHFAVRFRRKYGKSPTDDRSWEASEQKILVGQ